MKVELPILTEELCISCEDCVRACPTDCLGMNGPVPWLPRPLDCISCALCVILCPTEAITIPDFS